MAHYMPPPMLSLFAPRPPLPYMPPMDVYRKKPRPYTGLAAFKSKFKDPSELKPLTKHETPQETRERRKKRKLARGEKQAAIHQAKWKPQEDANATKDPYKTLFLGRLPYSATEETLRKEVERCGPVKQIRVVHKANTEEPRGYAFVEFEDAKDFKYAYRALDGIKMDGRRIIADVERGRTVPDWKPRSLGGGLGATRNGEKKKKEAQPARDGGHRRGDSGRGGEGHRYDDRRDSFRGGRDDRPPRREYRGRDDHRRDDRGGRDTRPRDDYRGGRGGRDDRDRRGSGNDDRRGSYDNDRGRDDHRGSGYDNHSRDKRPDHRYDGERSRNHDRRDYHDRRESHHSDRYVAEK